MNRLNCKVLFSAATLLFALAFWSEASAQQPVDQNRTKAVRHTVAKGQTLFSIAQEYGVTVQDIVDANPQASQGLNIDQVLQIPPPKTAAKSETLPADFLVHTVQPKETLYAITRKYSITEDELYKFNPTLRSEGLKAGGELKVPRKRTGPSRPAAPASGTKATTGKPADFLIHKVQPQETLYSIVRLYKTTTQAMYELNPTLESEGLKAGSEVKVPRGKTAPGQQARPTVSDPPTPKPVRDFDEPEKKAELVNSKQPYKGAYQSHVVEKGQTLFSLYREYGVSVDSIRLANNGLAEGLRLGDTIRIPMKGGLDYAKPVATTTTTTLGQPDNGIQYEDSAGNFSKMYNFSLMLPFFLDKNDTLEARRKEYEQVQVYGRSKDAIQFYQGFKLALDSLESEGVSIRLHVYDTNNDSNLVRSILNRREMKYMDLFVGPLYTNNFKMVSSYCKANSKHQVCPVPKSNLILLNNPHVSKLPASVPVQVSHIASYVAANHTKDNVLFLNTGDLRDETLVKTFRKRSEVALMRQDSAQSDTIPEVRMYTPELNFLRSKLDKERLNVLVVPTYKEAYVTSLLTKIYRLVREEYQIMVFGIEPWQKFTSKIDVNYLHAAQVHITDALFIDYTDPSVQNLITAFRKEYYTEPSAQAVNGFNAGLYYGRAIHKYGREFSSKLTEMRVDGVGSDLRFFKTGPESGYENNSVSILKFEDYKLVRVK